MVDIVKKTRAERYGKGIENVVNVVSELSKRGVVMQNPLSNLSKDIQK